MITDPNANVISRHDFLPFGEEIPGGVAGRSSKQFGPGLDNINQKFTSQERDSETLLDFFQARYFGGALGRFLSPDPQNAGASLVRPQSWNAYAYVANSPLSAVDPSGMFQRPIAVAPQNGAAFDEFDLMQIPVTTQVWTGPQTTVPPGGPDSVTAFGNGNGVSTSVGIYYAPLQTTSGSWSTVQIGTGADLIGNGSLNPNPASYDVPVGIDIWKGQQTLWSNTAGVGNTLAVATAAVAAAPVAIDTALGLGSSGVLSISPVQQGATVYRAYSGVNGSEALGAWWSAVNPTTVANYAEMSGMYNSGGYMALGTIGCATGFCYGFAEPNAAGIGGRPP